MCVLVHKNIQFHTVNLDQLNKEKDLDICALKLNLMTKNFAIICIYRSTSGNSSYFLNKLESILSKLYKTSNEFILHGDFNINYLEDIAGKNLLDSLLASFNFFSMINFPSRIFNISCALICDTHIKYLPV